MTKPRKKLVASVIALLIAAAAAGYYLVGSPDIRYVAASPETRRRLDTEKLQRDYRVEANKLDEQLRNTLQKDQGIIAGMENYNAVILNCHKKWGDMFDDVTKSANDAIESFNAATGHSLPTVQSESREFQSAKKLPLRGVGVPLDDLLLKEIRVDSVSDMPTSLRADDSDLLQRYHANVNVVFSTVSVGGKVAQTPIAFVANASPEKRWMFPSLNDVKQRILMTLNEWSASLQSETDLGLNNDKLGLDRQNLELKLKLDKKKFEEKCGR